MGAESLMRTSGGKPNVVPGNGTGGSAEEMTNSLTLVPGEELEEIGALTPFLAPESLIEEESLLEVSIREDDAYVCQEPAVHPSTNLQQQLGAASSLQLPDAVFSKLDVLLSRTQMFSEFLLERMDTIALNPEEEAAKKEQSGKGAKRELSSGVSPKESKRAKKATTDCQELSSEAEEDDVDLGDELFTEQERIAKEQKKIVPLLSGGILRSYQLKGVKWLISLWQNGLNGILADQMGLGKTIQTVGLLAHLKGKGMHGPFLICAPLSTLSNWVSEIRRWAPALPVILYHGTKDERGDMRSTMPEPTSPDFPVVVTSYEVAIHDRRFLSCRKWKYIVVDEGHRLKNFNCKLIRELKMIPTENSLLLTGTPLQNNLSELWSLLNFILPETFASLQQFESWFDLSGKSSSGLTKNENYEQQKFEVITKLHKILRPFLLRRLKQEVEKNMPLKKEIILYAPMTPVQLKFQNLLIDNTLNDYFAAKSKGVGFRSRINNVVMQLRKNANHPDLLVSHFNNSGTYAPVKDMVEQCGKLKLLERLLMQLKASGHKVLLFSQMTRMLDILEYYLQERGMDPCRIDGKVRLKERHEQMQDFNNDRQNRFIFLLSTRAGGLGINLTAADTVIIYDSDWNPHMDLQAMDRCHRIGQEKPVHVYRLVTAGSIECKMIKVGNCKMQLEHVVIEKGQFKQEKCAPKTKLEEYDLLALFGQDRDDEEEYVQSSVISDTNLLRALDRTELYTGVYSRLSNSALAFPAKGPGWEVVMRGHYSNSILSSIDGYGGQDIE